MKLQLTVVILITSACQAFSQTAHADSLFAGNQGSQIDSLSSFFSAQDSLQIFDLIDSLLKYDDASLLSMKSQMAIRLGYNSNITADNRTFNISQFGLAPGVSYYHKSGAYADLTSYWSSEYNPNLYLTVGAVGYMHTFSKKYSLLGEYSHYFYNQPSDSTVSVPYTNNFGISNYFEFKPLVLRLDYFLYFGERSAHRIMPSIGLNLVKRNWLGFDRVAFFPSFSVLFGSELITEYAFYPNLVFRYIYNQRNTPKLPYYYEINRTEFGVMNYGFQIPITFSKKQWTFLLSYAYNIPKSLPGETLSLENTGFASLSITRYISF